MIIIGNSSSEGGEQWVIFEHPVSGASVALSGGFDYGSWIDWACQHVTEQDVKYLFLWEKLSLTERNALKNHLMLTYPMET